MKKKEIAEVMLRLLHAERPDDVALVCEVTITCRKHVIRNRERNMSSYVYTRNDADDIIEGGELVDEVFPLLLKDDLPGVEALLKTYAS